MLAKNNFRIEQVYKGADHLTIVAEYTHKDPDRLFQFWIDPNLISKWWGPDIVEVDPRLEGNYFLSWSKQNWFLRGKYTQFQRAKLLAFTWKWDHEPNVHATQVRVDFSKLDNSGTRLTLTHGDYADGDAEQRKSHLDGWNYFLPRIDPL